MNVSITAIHEAGHDVVRHVLGVPCGGPLSIKRKGISFGRSVNVPCDHPSRTNNSDGERIFDPAEIRNDILICYAGQAAVARYCPDHPEQAKDGSDDDNEQANKLLTKLGETDDKPYRKAVSDMITDYWKPIVLIGIELDRWEELDDA
jgi:hypothetical protein